MTLLEYQAVRIGVRRQPERGATLLSGADTEGARPLRGGGGERGGGGRIANGRGRGINKQFKGGGGEETE